MQRDPLASSKARRAERKADEKSGLITIKPVKLDAQPVTAATATAIVGGGRGGGGSGFKKGGFKSAFAGDGGSTVTDTVSVEGEGSGEVDERGESRGDGEREKGKAELVEESDTEDEGYEMYDPRHPTD